jgi:hypothetical protein|tara:strand:- start:2451 stop:2972 length:522 start_codon:yes stop_codon:yes gene_type:complete
MSDEKCIICLEQLENVQNPAYELPQCKHKFHQGCINQWFRQGSPKCPLCNDTGTIVPETTHRTFVTRTIGMGRFKILRQQSRRKGANIDLVKEIDKIKKSEASLKIYIAAEKEYQNKIVLVDGEQVKVKDINRRRYKIKNKIRNKKWTLHKAKCTLSSRLNTIPIILVTKKAN